MGVWEVDCYCVLALILLPFEGAKGDRKAHPKTEKYGKLSVTFSHFINIDEAEKILTTLSDGINAPVGASVQVTVVDTTSPEVTAAFWAVCTVMEFVHETCYESAACRTTTGIVGGSSQTPASCCLAVH